MTPIFEAKYISIEWYDENTVLKINEAILPVSIEVESAFLYKIELQVYTRIENGLDGQIAFHIADRNSNIIPYFLDASNNEVPLIKIIDPSNGKVWWVERGKWSKSNKYRSSPLWNHIGDAKIIFGDIICDINIRANSFTREQLDLYLNDFRNDFWYLILQKDSITEGGARNTQVTLLDNDTIELISKFIEYIEKVLKNPKKELREVQRLKDIKKVKPVARTFMEIATTGYQRKMTSRDTVESYNVPENRYIHYILQRVYDMVYYMLRASGHMEEIYENKYKFDKERLENFSDKKTIDKEAFENEISDLKSRIEEKKIELESSILSQNDELKIELQKQINLSEKIQNALHLQKPNNNQDTPIKFIIKLENKRQNDGNRLQFWGYIKRIESDNWDNFGVNNWFSLEFNNGVVDFLEPGQEYIITAITTYTEEDIPEGIVHNIYFSYITELKLLNSEINNINDKLEYKTVIIKTYKNKEYNNVMQFNGEVQLPSGEWYKFNNNDFYSFEFDRNIFKSIINDFQIYEISAYVLSRNQVWNKNEKTGNIHKKYFRYITNIEQLSKSSIHKALEKIESARESLESTNWIRALTPQEKQEQDNERKALVKSTNLLKEQQKDNLELVKELEPKLHKLKQLLNKCEVLKIKEDSYFPTSMTFVQNPNYQGAHSFYKRVKDIAGVDENVFIQLQLVEKIGLIDIPTIYERWCFLQIIKVLIDKYKFLPEENWKGKLANQVVGDLNKIRDVKINFRNVNIGKEIALWYEKELPSKKRPDFVLDIKSTFNLGHTHRLVMDAKFHEEVDIEKQIDLLYYKKNYSEDNSNTVFILHPDAQKSIKKKRTPKKWGNDAYYGEIEMFNYKWDDKKPNHKYGAILLSPITKEGNYLDNLQRLIGMGMQYSLEENSSIIRDDMIDPEPKEKIFCLVCGSNKFHATKMETKKGHGYRYSFTCDDCEHYYVYNYCWQCHSRLIKNGEYWSYHSSQILEPFNIKCPNCSELLRG